MDYEQAVIKTLRQVFPQSRRVKCCFFHFRQAIYRRVQQEGLKAQYEDEASPVRRWIRQLLAMSAHRCPLLGRRSLCIHLLTSRHSDLQCTSSQHGSIQSDFPSMLWTHFALGRCTTHVDERFHNGMNSSFGTAHPSVRMFLDWLQKFEFEVQSRGL